MIDPTKTFEQVLNHTRVKNYKNWEYKWLNHTRVRDDEKWEHEFDDKESSKVIILPVKLDFVGTKAKDEDEDEPEDEPFMPGTFTLNKPDNNTLLDDTRSFRIIGTILASRTTDQGQVKRRCIPHDGLTYPLELIHNLETTTSYVLLTFSPDNFYALREYVIRNEPEGLVCLQVNWDKFSYLFLRKLRHNLGPQVHILAVTDLDAHHLDLLALLDTHPRYLPEYYGWDLSEQCANLGVQNIDVHIKWLDIRPTDIVDGSRYRSYFPIYASKKDHVDSPDICRSLLEHPHLISSRAPWLVELRTISDHKLYCSLPLISLQWNTGFRHHRDDLCGFYLPEKIKKCDWY